MEKEEKVRSLNQNDVVAPSSRFTSFHSVLFFPFISMCSYYLSAFRKRRAVQDGSPKLSHHATENKEKKHVGLRTFGSQTENSSITVPKEQTYR